MMIVGFDTAVNQIGLYFLCLLYQVVQLRRNGIMYQQTFHACFPLSERVFYWFGKLWYIIFSRRLDGFLKIMYISVWIAPL